jgi:choline dehydrogenase-like flavoprotein
MRSLFGVGEDWPLDFEELERYYGLAESRIGVAAPANPHRPRASAPRFPAHPLSYASARLVPAFAAAGLTLIPNSLAILPRAFRGRPACNYCNGCAQGCPIGDKGSADVTFVPAALATGRLDLRPRSQVLRVSVDRRGLASGVVYADARGARRRVEARFVVLAAGAVETPRLLLLSRNAAFPGGLANGSGQVGRNLTEMLSWSSRALHPEPLASYRGIPMDGSAWDLAVPHEDRDAGYVGGFRLATAHGITLRGPVSYATRVVPGFGVEHQRRMAEAFGRGVALLAFGEWIAGPRTRVDLDPQLRDARGLPLARITSHLGANERALLRRMAATTRAVLAAAGARLVGETSTLDQFRAAHVLGTCRMGPSAARFVADPDGFAHEVPNLAFADGSVIPTSGCGDSPFLTITAMALRTSDRLLERARLPLIPPA